MSHRKIWTFEELAVSRYESARLLRGTFPKYTLRVDGQSYWLKSRKSLENLLANIISETEPRVFPNAGFGVTIDFDNP